VTPSGARIVVIGAGAAGLSTAWYAAALGAQSVTVIDKRHAGEGSSGLSAGVFNRQTFEGVDLEMRRHSLRVFDQMEASGLLTLYRTGYVRLARTPQQFELIRSTVEQITDGTSRLVTADQIADMVPGIRTDDITGGMFGPVDGHLDGPGLCSAYLAAGKELGVVYQPRTELLGAVTNASGVTLSTSQGSLQADIVVNAAGAWLGQVSALLGIDTATYNQRHQIAQVRVPSLANRADIPMVQTYFPGSGYAGIYIRPEGQPGNFIAGTNSYENLEDQADADEFRRGVDESFLESIAEGLIDRFPGWEDASLTGGWSGLYPNCADGGFLIGPHRANPRVVVVGGLGGRGLTTSAAAGRLGAEWAVLGEARLFDFADELLPDRPGARIATA
jgi:sarcosine oxidase subunit beta